MGKKLLIIFFIGTLILSSAFLALITDNRVTVYVTTSDRTFNFRKDYIELEEGNTGSLPVITIDTTKRYQKMEGFGAALTGSSCYNLLKMSQGNRTKFLKETFSVEDGLGYSYIRISIGCSDFSLNDYTCCDKPGIENFSLQSEELDYVIPVLKEIIAINPDIKILGSPWTCPRWMKVNNLKNLEPYNSWTSGHLNPEYYSDYATYFVKWISAFATHGIMITSVTPQNEPLNRGNSASLFMGWEEQREFVKELGKKLKAANLSTEIYVFDHNYNYDRMKDQVDYPVNIYKDRQAAQYITGAAYHDYGGSRDELLDIHDKAPDKSLIFTETSIGEWNDGRNLEERLVRDMEQIGLGTVNNWCKAVIVWNLMLDTDKSPYRPGGCGVCYGAVDIDNNNYSTITRNSHYYVIGHLSAVVKPNAIRVNLKGNISDEIISSAFLNQDGSYAIVMANKSSNENFITLSGGGKHFSYTLPSNAIASFIWQ
jgi:glucosylceramidase